MTLKVAPKLTLPIELAGESTAILAKKGAGKSNTAKVIVEEVLDHGGVQVIVLDPIGHWWSLRAGANGKPGGGYPVAVFGGMHGDLPLEEHAGKLLAQTAVESGQSMVLDVSSLDSNGAMQRFVYEFLEELYKLKQATPTPVLLVLEEADEFAPQDPKGSNVPRMVGAANRISKRGRGRGIGMLYVTQRSAALNKNVLDQSDTLIVMRTIGPRDRKAIEGWVQHADAEGSELVLPSLPSLETGEAWIWTPERDLLQRVKIRKARTFDSSATPKPGEAAIVATPKPIDVAKLGEAIKATVERVKENDPAELRKRIRELERTQDTGHTAAVEQLQRESHDRLERIRELEARDAVIVEVPVLTDEERELLTGVARTINESLAKAGQASDALVELLADIPARFERAQAKEARRDEGTVTRRSPPAAPQAPRPAPAAQREPAHAPRAAAVTDENVTGPQQRILNALAALEQIGVDAPVKVQLALFGEASPKSSSFSNNLGHLNNQLGLITYPQPGRVALTDAGRAIADAGDAPRTVDELHRYVAGLVGPAKWRILEVLVDAYPDDITKVGLAERAGASPSSSSFSNNLGSLRTLGLIGYPAPGMVIALPVLFPGGR